jgi:hypothetical protein
MDVVSKSAEMQEELISRTDVKDSPFQVIGIEGKYFGCMGNYRLTEQFDTEEEVLDDLDGFSWNRVVQVMMLLNEKLNVNDLNKEEK